MTENPICTVLLITYNHAPYIAQCIDSVLSQKTKYPFIIKIFDDASTDGSSDIVRAYAAKYPDKIEAHIAQNNQGAQTNIWNAWNSVNTKYACLMETDDWWCDDEKLELQISALEEHPECSFCGAQTEIKQECADIEVDKQFEVRDYFFKNKNILSYNDILPISNSFSPHPNACCVNMKFINFETIKNKETITYGLALFFYLLSKGSMYYLYRTVGVYRRTGKGIYTSKNQYERIQFAFTALLNVNEDTNFALAEKIFTFMNTLLSWRLSVVHKQNALQKSSSLNYIKKKRFYFLGFLEFFKTVEKFGKKRFYICGLPFAKIKLQGKFSWFYLFGIPVVKIK